jgi:redox-sensing transcriptional repressor
MDYKKISQMTLQRLPVYLKYLKSLNKDETVYISSSGVAAALHAGEVQVRKDLASICSSGRPKVGYLLSELIWELEDFLGYNNASDAVIVGAGKLGAALLSYSGFEETGVNIIAAFDKDEKLAGKTFNGKSVFPMSKFRVLCRRMNIKIGIITVPALEAPQVCKEMISCGIIAIWNFAPAALKVPGEILLKNENMAGSLTVLSNHLKEKFKQSKKHSKEKEYAGTK